MLTTAATRFRFKRRVAIAVSAALSLVAGLVFSVVSAPRAEAVELIEVGSFGSNPGALRMFNYVPAQTQSAGALVVVLHGCQQTATAFGADSGWIKMATTHRFAVVLPQQSTSNNPMSCFNWFEPGDSARGSGEALSIKQMVDNVRSRFPVAPSRVFVTGLSAGAFMTSNLLAAYPDVFAGGAVVAGGPARCATASSQAFMCMNPGSDKTPRQWGDLVRSANPGWSGPWPKLSVWHGTSDWVVNVKNMAESVEQWTDVHGADQTADVSDTVRGYPHKVYRDPSGRPVVETYQLTSQAHGQPLDPGSATDQCGTAGATAMKDMNICAAYHIADYFDLTS